MFSPNATSNVSMAEQKRKAEPSADDASTMTKFKLDRALNLLKKDFHGTANIFMAKDATRKSPTQQSNRFNKSKLDLPHDLNTLFGGFRFFTDATAKDTATRSSQQDSRINKL